MGRLFRLIGIVGVLLVVGGGVGFFFLARTGAALDASSRSYADQAVVAIAKTWNTDELWKRASPEFKKSTQPDDLAMLFDAANAALGPLVEYEGAQGDALIAKAIGSDGDIRARYVAQGRFAKDQAVFDISLRQINDVWMIDGFHVRSASLMKRLAREGR
jgi:hypothetical protein